MRSLFLDPKVLEDNNHEMAAKYRVWEQEEVRYTTYNLDDNQPELLIAAFGTMARICMTAIDELKEEGVNIGLFRPVSLYPFPKDALREAGQKVGKVLTVEMNMGQMIEDVQAAVGHDVPVTFFGRTGGIVPTPDEVMEAMRKAIADKS